MDNAAFQQMLAKATEGASKKRKPEKDEMRNMIEDEDKRMKALEKKKEKNRERNEQQAAAKASRKSEGDGSYRDRAEERRKEANPDYDDELTRMVALDVEKSKCARAPTTMPARDEPSRLFALPEPTGISAAMLNTLTSSKASILRFSPKSAAR